MFVNESMFFFGNGLSRTKVRLVLSALQLCIRNFLARVDLSHSNLESSANKMLRQLASAKNTRRPLHPNLAGQTLHIRLRYQVGR